MFQTLCLKCSFCREVVSGKGSRFLLCQKSHDDRRYPKYPQQPVRQCPGYVEAASEPERAP